MIRRYLLLPSIELILLTVVATKNTLSYISANGIIVNIPLFGSTSLCENSATHEALHVDNLLTRGHPQAAAAARPENSGDEYVVQLSWESMKH